MSEQPQIPYTAPRRLTRSLDDRWLSGVCGGDQAHDPGEEQDGRDHPAGVAAVHGTAGAQRPGAGDAQEDQADDEVADIERVGLDHQGFLTSMWPADRWV